MEPIAGYVDRHFRALNISRYDLQDLGLITWGRRNCFIGIVLENDVLLLDYKYFVSSRIKKANLGNIPYQMYYGVPCGKAPFGVDYLRSYFSKNSDNPYGLWNVFQVCIRNEFPDELTQFPPLSYSKKGESTIEQLQQLARPADFIFTFDRSSGLSRLIRKSDRCMWSHVAMVSDSGTLIESTTSGVVESPFSRLTDDHLEVGLYRHNAMSNDSQAKVVEAARKSIGIKGYNWYVVVRIYLQQSWHIPFRRREHEVTSADIMYGNQLRLIAYA